MINTNAAFNLIQKGCDLAYEIAVNNPTVDALSKRFRSNGIQNWQQIKANINDEISEAKKY